MVRLLLLLLPAFVFGSASAQSLHTLSGTLEGGAETGDALLLRAADSALVKYAPVTAGAFRFEAVPAGTYLLRLSCSGFAELSTPLQLDADRALSLRLERRATDLQGVTVTGSRRTLVSRNGNTHVNVEGSPLAGQPDPLALLGKLPAIQVAPDGSTLSVVGRGAPLLYLDGRRITPEDLRAIAVQEIRSIDIVNNPSARYEAEGRTVILITLRHARKDERRLDLSETALLRKYYTNRLAANALRKHNAVEWKAGLQYNEIHNWEGNAYDFTIPASGRAAGYDVTSHTRRTQVIATGGFYRAGKGDDYLSAGLTLRGQGERYPISTVSYLQPAAQGAHVVTDNRNRQHRFFATANLNWSKKLPGAAGRLFLGAQQTHFTHRQHSDIFDAVDGAPLQLNLLRDQRGDIGVTTARADWERTLPGEGKLEAGLLYSTPHSVNGTDTYGASAPVSQEYHYRESDAAAYVQASGKKGKNELSAGLRAEATTVRGAFAGADPLLERRQLQLFPKASLSRPLDSTKTVTLSYARSIQRPDYASISGVVQYINPWFDWVSNVSIGPTVTQEVSAQLQYKTWSAKLAWYRNDGPVYSSFDWDALSEHLRRQDVNFDREWGGTLTLDLPFQKGRWSASNSVIAGINTVRDRRAAAQGSTPYVYAYSQQQFKLPGGYVWLLTGTALTARREGVFERNGNLSLDTSLSKTFRNKVAVTLSANNVFNSLHWTESFAVGDVAATGTFYTKPDFALSLRWSVGGVANTRFRNREVDENAGRVR